MNIKNLALISLLLLSNLAQAGLYFGLAPGLLVDGVDVTSNQLGFTLPDEVCNVNGSFSSFTPGVLLGYAHVFDLGVVTGLEIDFSNNTNQTVNQRCQCTTTPSVSDNFSFFNNMQGSLRGRFGYTFLGRSLLLFATGGGSIANLGLDYSNENSDDYMASAVVPGWLVGGGLEWNFATELSLRGEYHYVSYNNVDLAIPTIYGLTDPNGAAHASSSAHSARLAINYWFW